MWLFVKEKNHQDFWHFFADALHLVHSFPHPNLRWSCSSLMSLDCLKSDGCHHQSLGFLMMKHSQSSFYHLPNFYLVHCFWFPLHHQTRTNLCRLILSHDHKLFRFRLYHLCCFDHQTWPNLHYLVSFSTTAHPAGISVLGLSSQGNCRHSKCAVIWWCDQ